MKTTYKIEVTFQDKKRAEQFKGDMLNLEYYGIEIGNIYEANELCAKFMHLTIGTNTVLVPTPELDYPDGDEG